MLIIDVAVTPAVKKYIAAKHCVDPFVLSRTNPFGLFLYNCLSRLKTRPSITIPELKPDIYTEQLDVLVSDDLWARRGWYIHPKKQYDFNRLVEMMIDQDFQFYVKVKTGIVGHTMYSSFLNFRDEFGMTEDDLAMKTMEKRYQRHRERLSA